MLSSHPAVSRMVGDRLDGAGVLSGLAVWPHNGVDAPATTNAANAAVATRNRPAPLSLISRALVKQDEPVLGDRTGVRHTVSLLLTLPACLARAKVGSAHRHVTATRHVSV